MKVSKAVNYWLEYHKANSKKNTVGAYEELIAKFCNEYGYKDLNELTSEEVMTFLNVITEGRKPQTRKTRFSHLTSFFNFTGYPEPQKWKKARIYFHSTESILSLRKTLDKPTLL